MICKPEEFTLSDDQKKELLNITGEFLGKYFSREVLSNIEIKISFLPKPKNVFLSLTYGCVEEAGADDPRCDLGYAWKIK
jgi:hypothetical protein